MPVHDRQQIERIRTLATLIRDTACLRLAATDRAMAELRGRLAALDGKGGGDAATPPTVMAQVQLRHQAWAGERRAQLNTRLAALMALREEQQAAARLATARADVLSSLARKGRGG